MRLIYLIGIVLILGSLIGKSEEAVLGIDVGSQYLKASLIAPGKSFLIIENLASKRKSETSIAFANNQRWYESNSLTKRTKFPKNTFVFIDKFLGALESNKEVFEISKKYYEEYIIQFDENRGTVLFQLDNYVLEDDTDNIVLRVEEVFAMIIKQVKFLAEKQAGIQIRDCVLTVPTDWNMDQRYSLNAAVQIAEMNLISLIYENSAAALFYGLERNDVNKTHNVIFYNIGSTKIQVTLAQYTATNTTDPTKKSSKRTTIETVNILADATVNDAGGLTYDYILAQHFADEIDALRKQPKSIRENRRTMNRLMSECNKLKEVLSANKEAVFQVEGLYDGNDFRSKIDRSLFEQKAQPLFDKLLPPIEKVLQISGLTKDQIDQVELIGGGVRIPKIQHILASYFGEALIGQHLNGDEVMAYGASFHGANLSHSFRVREVYFSDGFNYKVQLVIKNQFPLEPSHPDYIFKNTTIFDYKKRFGTKKNILLTPTNDLTIELYGVNLDNQFFPLASYNLTNISDAYLNDKHYNDTIKVKLQLEFKIDSVEGVFLNEANINFNYTEFVNYTEKVTKSKKIPLKNATDSENTTDTENTTENKSDTESKTDTEKDVPEPEETGQENDSQEQPKDQEEGQNEAENENPETASEETDTEDSGYRLKDGELSSKKEKVKKDKKTKQKQQDEEEEEFVIRQRARELVRTLRVEFTEQLYGIPELDKTDLRLSKKKLRKFDDHEENIRKLSEIKNRLESLIYQSKDYLEQELFIKASTEAEREAIQLQSVQSDEWLYSDEGREANFTVANNKYLEFASKIGVIMRRIEEYNYRPQAVNRTVTEILSISKKIEKLNKTMPWITDEQKVKAYNLINSTLTWIREKWEEQDKRPLNQDPIFSIEELKPKFDLINREYTRLKNIKKPKIDLPPTNSTGSSSQDGETNAKKNTKKPKSTKNDKSDKQDKNEKKDKTNSDL